MEANQLTNKLTTPYLLQSVSSEKVNCKEPAFIAIFYFLKALKPKLVTFMVTTEKNHCSTVKYHEE